MHITASDAWQETLYLLRSPANAKRLMEAVERDRNGSATVTKTLEERSSRSSRPGTTPDNTHGSE